MKKGQITLTGGGPLQLEEDVDCPLPELTDEQVGIVRQVGAAVKAYLSAAEALLVGKYAHLQDWAPAHLRAPGNVLVACCADGVVVRYEPKATEKRYFIGWFPGKLPEVASLLSQKVVRCRSSGDDSSEPPEAGIAIKLSTQDATTKEKGQDIFSGVVVFEVVIERPDQLPVPPQKPFCLLSIRNMFEIHLLGEMAPEHGAGGNGKRFLIRGAVRLPVGWDCIEVFPFFQLQLWNPEFAPAWAERDLLAAVVAGQNREVMFDSLDPNAAARRRHWDRLKRYKALLDSNPDREEILQRFLYDNPDLLCPTHIKVWAKLALGAKVTDFVFQLAAGDYLLVEIERSTHRLFLKNGDASKELNHARGQILDWRRYIEDNLSTVQRELGLTGISANPKGLIVIGRSEMLTGDHRRKLLAMENESPNTKIMTYDDVYENAKAVVENLLGPIWEQPEGTKIYYLPKGQAGNAAAVERAGVLLFP